MMSFEAMNDRYYDPTDSRAEHVWDLFVDYCEENDLDPAHEDFDSWHEDYIEARLDEADEWGMDYRD